LSASLPPGLPCGGKKLRTETAPGTASLIFSDGLRETDGESARNGVTGGGLGLRLSTKWDGGLIKPSATRGGDSDGDNRAQKLGNPLGDELADDEYPSSSDPWATWEWYSEPLSWKFAGELEVWSTSGEFPSL